MPGGRRIEGDMTDIGEQAKPSFAVLPDVSTLFLTRADRLAALAGGHELEPYLRFLSRLTEIQHTILGDLPPASLPEAGHMAQALEHGMPPLSRASIEPDAAMLATVERFIARLAQEPFEGATADALAALQDAIPPRGRELVASVLKDITPPENLAQSVLILAALQVHFARLAAMLDPKALKPIANACCPTCGSPPMTSSVVGWRAAPNTRYCTCGLCGTMWNVIRVMCVLCGATEGVSFRSIDGQPETVKAETCDTCRGYVKIIYEVKDHTLEPLSDDVASVGLDILLAEEGWKRGGQNPFLLGY
jgi:FdhE protein